MPTDKQLLIDLTALTPESTAQLASIQEDIVKDLEKSGKRTKTQTRRKTTKAQKQKIVKDLPIEELFSGNFLTNQIKSGVLKFGPLLLVTGVFVEQLLKLNKLNKKFLDIANKRISVFIERQQQALIETFQNQVIYTTKAGVTSSRDVYNSFNLADTVNKNNGLERDVTSFGGLD